MLLRLHRLILIVSLVTLIGGHWAILQSAAWVGMVINHSQRSTVTEAVEKTFSGEFPCKLCKFVRAGQAAEKKQVALKVEAKLEFCLAASTTWLFPPRFCRQFKTLDSSSLARLEAPLTPPPRGA